MKYIFVDVDSVLNPDVPRSGGFRHEAKLYPGGPVFALNLHEVYSRWLLDLSEKTGAFLVWGSTWQQHANEHVGRPLGLPHLSHLELTPAKFNETLGCVKARAAIEYAQGNPFVFFDDEPDLRYYLYDSRGLHIHVNARHGLTRRHLIEAEKFLAENDAEPDGGLSGRVLLPVGLEEGAAG